MQCKGLYWCPERADWSDALRTQMRQGGITWSSLVKFASYKLDYTMTLVLDRALRSLGDSPPADLMSKPVRLAVLGSSNLDHLLPGIRVGGLRRGLWIETYSGQYGQYHQDLSHPPPDLVAFSPTCTLIALDALHLVGELSVTHSRTEADRIVDRAVQQCVTAWDAAHRNFNSRVIHQIPLPFFERLLGHNEQRLAGSKVNALQNVSRRLREAAEDSNVDIMSLDALIAEDGIDEWHDAALWHKAKHEVRASAAPVYGDHVARILAAQQGRSAKCLVIDLDNTIWGGVIGDDGIEGIALGQGSALGEAFVGLQKLIRDLSQRGVILAVCSKNDEANALLPFDRHPEMVLRRTDIACFVANWADKPSNLRAIARTLNIGADSLVFLDDNPFERNLVRQELPEVVVPELPEEPSLYGRCLIAGGFFETTSVTSEDLERTVQYQANIQREAARAATTDVEGYLRELNMELRWARFDRVGLMRIVQLINKTNQFNLTTRRYSEDEVLAVMSDPRAITLQLRLIDRLGDNGIIAILIARPKARDLVIDTWLMSCRVLGRKIEQATLNVVMEEAARLDAQRVVGAFVPSPKNQIVKDHYKNLDFIHDESLNVWWREVAQYSPIEVPVSILQTELSSA
jgi:FkbH-like protein